jgi:UDP-MurNAc hydroxylase
MRFQVVSHAGILVENNQNTLMCDPWILGSCYWRSWWNYPPVTKELADALDPDFIYLTHIHWDHFQGDSLRKLGKDKTIIVPKGNYDRIKRDLHQMGFHNVVELKHGETFEVNPNFKITSYQFGVFLDSAIVLEVDGKVLLNLNDSKHMGPTLKQILKNHPPIDFVFRSHSSANSRLCYEIVDDEELKVDDISQYIKNFANTVLATGAKYAVPFASNHCHLHPEVMHFNEIVQTPRLVEQYFQEHNITETEVKVMVSGDIYSDKSGFAISDDDWFENRKTKIAQYFEEKRHKIDAQNEKEAKIGVKIERMEKYFSKFVKNVPWIMRRGFNKNPITYILKQGEKESIFNVNLCSGKVQELENFSVEKNPIQIHVSAFLMRQCMGMDLFSHLSISKRVKYKTTKKGLKYLKRLNSLFNLYEYDMLPVHRMFQWRSIETWVLRWREVLLYGLLVKDKLIHKEISFDKYLILKSRKHAG